MREKNVKVRKNRSLKKFVLMSLITAMVFTAAMPVWAAGEKWTSVADGDILIQDTVTKIADGVFEHEVITNNKEGNDQKIDYLCEIEPSDTIKVVSGYGKDNAEKWSLTSTTAQANAYMKNHEGETVVAGINADFFNMGTGEPLGALVMEGKEYHSANGRYYFGITKEGEPVIRNSADLSDLQTAVGGDALLIDNGAIMTENTAYGAIDYSRTAIGYKEDGTIVTFVTYGNRAPVSCGRNYLEVAQMLKNAGCIYALALDCGGSSTLISRPEGTTGLQLRNHPVDGAEREVGSSLLVVSTKEKTGVFSHAQLTPNNEVYTPGSQVQFEANGVDTAGVAMDLPDGCTWALAEESKTLGTIDAATGVFTANDKTGVVTVNLMKDGQVIGETSIEIVVPDSICFATEEVSLGFEEESDLGIVVRSKGRDVHYKDGDINWTIDDETAGTFTGNIFKSSDGNSVTTKATAVSAYDESVLGTITVIVGKLPTIVWDFEDVTTEDGTVIPAEDYYVNGYKSKDENGTETDVAGILNTSNYGRGGNESIEIANLNDDEPVRFGANSLKLNYDFTQCGEVTEGACVGTTAGMAIPGVPTGIGVWVYAPEGVGIEWKGTGTQAGFWLRGYVRDGDNNNVPYDFTLEPKVCDEEGEIPGIYWEGWKYLEADLTKLQAPYSIQPGMTFRLMYVAGTQMGTKSANSIYLDNLQFVYGTNVDDIDNPVIDSITVNGKELTDNEIIDTNIVNIDSIFHDVQNKYTTGIDDATVRMYVDGVNVVDNEKYEYAYADSMTHIYNLKLKDGSHSVTVSVRDGFGNETSETRNFIIDTDNEIEETTVKVVPVGDAILGGKVQLQIQASDSTVTESTTVFKLGSQFKDYEVIYSDNYDGTTTYSKLNKTITVKATRKDDPTAMDNNVIATVEVAIPADLLEEDVFSYTVKSGKFETVTGAYDTYSASEIKMPVKAGYNVSVDPIIIGGADGVVEVTDAEGNAAPNVTVYLADDNSEVGRTDGNGQLVTTKFNEEAGEYKVYAKDDEGKLSFQYKLYSYNPQGDETGLPHNVRFNFTKDPSAMKNISWMSNPLVDEKQVLQYAEAGSGNWVTVEAEKTQTEFAYNGFNVTDVNSVLLDGLKAGTTYDYKIGIEGAMSEVKQFSTESADRTASKFFILGDIQDPDKTNLSTIADKLQGTDYNFGVQIGDAIDQANDYTDWSELGKIVGEGKLGDTDMISVMGNHEYYGDADASISSAIYNNPVTEAGSYYSIENGNIYMAVINFCDNTAQVKKAAEWLKKDAAESDAIWKIVLTHQPAYFTNSVGGNDPVYDYLPDACEEAGIQAVFSGHDHAFARTNPLIDDKVDEEKGIVYYVTGAIGSKRYPVSTQDKFDYTTIFNYLSDGFTATYLTVESDMDEMTIKMYELGNDDPVNVYTVESACKKNDHKCIYNPENGDVKCKVCKKSFEEYTGDVFDKDGNEYNLLAGKPQTGWITVGEEFRYYDEKGIREEVTKVERPSDCTIDGWCDYTSASGATYHERYNDAGGHEYEDKDGKRVCSVCGWTRVNMEDCNVKLSFGTCTYTGKEKKPTTVVTNPAGDVLDKGTYVQEYRTNYSNNVEIGTATVEVKARNKAGYTNINEWRGSYYGSTTVTFDICPDAPKNAIAYIEDAEANLAWDASEYGEEYVVYQSVNGGTWKAIGTTKKCEYKVTGLSKSKTYTFRVKSIATGLDENGQQKEYESAKYASVKVYKHTLKVSYNVNGKPVLQWNRATGVKYTVYRATTKNGTFKKIYTTSTGNKVTNTSATAGKTYYYKVMAELDGKYVGQSDVVKATARLGKAVVTAGHNLSTGKPKLTWKKVDGADSYQVYRSTTGKSGSFKKIYTTEGTSFTNKDVKVGATYYYKVAAVSESLDTKTYSDAHKLTCTLARPVVKISNVAESGKPRLTWEAVDKADKYEVYRATSKNGTYKKVYTTTKTRYTNTGAVAGKTYYYKVKAIYSNKTAANSAFSTDKNRTCDLARPVVKASVNANGKPKLTWEVVNKADKYEVYRSTSQNGTYKKIYTTTKTSFVNTSVAAGKTYYYKVKAIYSDKTAANSALSTAKKITSK